MPPTIRDVARQAGVGLGTVSRVLNDSPHVSQATRQRVLAVIEKLNFSPNPVARRLSLGKSLTIGVVAPFFTRPAFVERLRGIEHACAPTQYDLAVYNVERPERGSALLRELAQHMRVDGLIVISLPPSQDELDLLKGSGVTTVLIDVGDPPREEVSRVQIDDVAGGRQATEHLIQLGHRRIGFIGDRFKNPSSASSPAATASSATSRPWKRPVCPRTGCAGKGSTAGLRLAGSRAKCLR